jgi:hypothetical protein
MGFDQRGQQVGYQYNAEGDINFNTAQSSGDLVAALEKLQREFLKAKQAGIIDGEVTTDVEYHITKAVQLSKKADPEKKTIIDHLNTAKAIIGDITLASALTTALVDAIESVRRLFS